MPSRRRTLGRRRSGAAECRAGRLAVSVADARLLLKPHVAGFGACSGRRPLLVDVEQVERVGAVFVGGAAVGAGGLESGVARSSATVIRSVRPRTRRVANVCLRV